MVVEVFQFLPLHLQLRFGVSDVRDVYTLSEHALDLLAVKIRRQVNADGFLAAIWCHGSELEHGRSAGQCGLVVRFLPGIANGAEQIQNAHTAYFLRRLAEPFEVGLVGKPVTQIRGPIGNQAGHGIGQ